MRGGDPAVEPVGEEDRRDPVAGLEAGHRSADRHDFAGAVRAGDDRALGPSSREARDRQVAVVQRDGGDTDADVIRTGFWSRPFGRRQGIEPFAPLEFVYTHNERWNLVIWSSRHVAIGSFGLRPDDQMTR